MNTHYRNLLKSLVGDYSMSRIAILFHWPTWKTVLLVKTNRVKKVGRVFGKTEDESTRQVKISGTCVTLF